MVIPFVAAYGTFLELGLLFAVWTFLFSIPFLLLCAGIGSIAVLLLVRWSPTGRALKWLCAAIPLVGALLIWSLWQEAYDPDANVQFTLSRIVPGLRPATNKLIPSWWVAAGILALTRGELVRGGMLWLVLATTTAMLVMVVEWIGSATFVASWRRVLGTVRRGRHAPVLFPFAERLLRGIGADVRAVALKDVRIFFRDPTQWSQALIFFGLLALYFSNLRNFRYHALPDAWRNTITFLNVFSVSAVVCSLGSRSVAGATVWTLALTAITTLIPLRLGARSLAMRDY